MLAHKAVHEAHVAAEVIAGELQGNKELAAAAFNAHVIPSVAYTDPEVAWVGLTEDSGLARKVSRSKRACSLGPHPAAPLPTAATRALPNTCLMTHRKRMATARFWAAAWSERTRAT
jgi:pyruvate/2-oxoglutarate dehydrogenase complex dihydrolipoamide dehydrogenase (E3) component